MDPSFESGFLLDISSDRTVRDDDPFDLRSLIHSTSKQCVLGGPQSRGDPPPATETLIQIEEDPWSGGGVLDWERLRSEASALAALAQEENTDWEAIQVEASAVAGSIKFSTSHLLSHSSSSPMSPLSLGSPLSTIFSAGGMSPSLLDSPSFPSSFPSSSSATASPHHLSLRSKTSDLLQKQRAPLTPANRIFSENNKAQTEMKKTRPGGSHLPLKPSLFTFPPKNPPATTDKPLKPPSGPTSSSTRPPPNHRASPKPPTASRSISVPKKVPSKPVFRRSISNLSQSQLTNNQEMTSSGPSTAAATTTTTTTPYMKKSLTLPRKRPTNKNGSSVLHNGSRIQAPSSRVNTTPSTHRGGGGSFGSNNSSVVSSTPAHKGTRPHHKFSQPGLPSPIVKHSRFKK